jgi:hypothetical protein
LRGAWEASRIAFALFLGVEVLVDPADRLVLGPERRDLVAVDELKRFGERRLARKQTALGAEAVEEGRKVCGVEIEQAVQEMPIRLAGVAERAIGDPLIKLEGLRLGALGQ